MAMSMPSRHVDHAVVGVDVDAQVRVGGVQARQARSEYRLCNQSAGTDAHPAAGAADFAAQFAGQRGHLVLHLAAVG
jgi:hypothetical protein